MIDFSAKGRCHTCGDVTNGMYITNKEKDFCYRCRSPMSNISYEQKQNIVSCVYIDLKSEIIPIILILPDFVKVIRGDKITLKKGCDIIEVTALGSNTQATSKEIQLCSSIMDCESIVMLRNL